MKRLLVFTTLLATLLLSGCGGSGGGATLLPVNAPGFEGIGDLKVGGLETEALSHLSKVDTLWTPSKDVAGSEVSRYLGEYPLGGGESVSVYLTFFRDSLAILEVGKTGGQSKKLHDALTAKYGEGYKAGNPDFLFETWVGETATALYEYQTDNNPDPYHRKTREAITITPKGRDIYTEIYEYEERVQTEQEEERLGRILENL